MITTLAGGHARHAGYQYATAAMDFLEIMRARMDRHTPSDFGHWREQRQTAFGIGHRFIGNGDGARLHQAFGLLGIGGKMQVGKQHLILAQHFAFGSLRFFNLHDHIRFSENGCGIGRDLRAGGFIIIV